MGRLSPTPIFAFIDERSAQAPTERARERESESIESALDDDWFERALSALSKLNEKFAVVHVHANNYRPLLAIGNVLFPEVLEVTYASRAKYTFTDCDDVFPGPLDSPNWPAAADYGLGKFVY